VLHRVFAGLRGLTGLVLVALGIALAVGLRSFALLDRAGAPLWRAVHPYARRLSGPSTVPRALAFGALWGLLPCGMVYAALGLAAATGSPVRGGVTMLAFGSGTLPALVLIGSLASRLRALVARRSVRAAVGLAVALSGFLNVATALPDAWCGGVFASTTHACCHTKADAP
jgi:sulfite exporter TauE/SafE